MEQMRRLASTPCRLPSHTPHPPSMAHRRSGRSHGNYGLAVAAAATASHGIAAAEVLGVDSSWVNCWEEGKTRESCCEPGAAGALLAAMNACFDSIYTRRECCDGGGVARLFPVAEVDPPSWAGGAAWMWGGSPGKEHPAYSDAQRAWEAEMHNSSTMMKDLIMGQNLRLWVFKRSVADFSESMQELSDDEYGLARLSARLGSAPRSERLTAIDVGASVGMFAILLARYFSPAMRVVAVEAAPANYRYLLWNIRVNGVAHLVWPINAALDGTAAAARVFYYSPTYPRTSQVCNGDGCGAGDEVSDESWRGGWVDWQARFEVPQVTLAELLAALDVREALHLLKVDCEGCEWGVFTGPSWPRVRHRVRHVVSEIHTWALSGREGGAALEADLKAELCRHELNNGPDFYVCSTFA